MNRSFTVKQLILIILLAIGTMVLSSCAKKKDGGIKFTFASYKTYEDVEEIIYYSDDYFNSPASEYNNKLSSASICLALAGFSPVKSGDYSRSSKNAKALLTKLGFSNFESNNDGITKPTKHSFGVYIASKTIDGYTLIGVTVRGAGYQSEWASNFSLGTNGDYADGFFEASTIYINALKSYISNYGINGKIKIWTSGYSRGGAGVNLSIGRIDEALINNEKLLGDSVTYTKDDIYAYCFEAPAGRIYNLDSNGQIIEKGENYSNIHCVLNINDPVPYVGPIEYGFVRFGTDYYLPDILTDINYTEHIDSVKNIMTNLPNKNVIGDYLIDTFIFNGSLSFYKKANYPLSLYLKTFIDEFAKGVGSRENYSTTYETFVCSLFELIYKNDTPKDSMIDVAISIGKNILLKDTYEVVLTDLQHNLSRVWLDLKPLIEKAIKDANIEGLNVDDVMVILKELVSSVLNMAKTLDGLALFPSILSLNNIKTMGSAHIPELELSHVFALDNNYNKNVSSSLTTSYFKLVVSSSSPFTIYSGKDKIAECSYKDKICDTKMVCDYFLDEYTFYLPTNGSYKVECDGEINGSLFLIRTDHLDSYLYDGSEASNIVMGDITW